MLWIKLPFKLTKEFIKRLGGKKVDVKYVTNPITEVQPMKEMTARKFYINKGN